MEKYGVDNNYCFIYITIGISLMMPIGTYILQRRREITRNEHPDRRNYDDNLSL